MVSTRLGFCCFDGVQNFFAGAGIQTVEHLGDGADAAIRFAAEFAEGLQFLADHAGDFVDDFGGDLIEVRHAKGHIGTEFRRERDVAERRPERH